MGISEIDYLSSSLLKTDRIVYSITLATAVYSPLPTAVYSPLPTAVYSPLPTAVYSPLPTVIPPLQ